MKEDKGRKVTISLINDIVTFLDLEEIYLRKTIYQSKLFYKVL